MAKKDVNASDIKANIYDTIELTVDINGMTSSDLELKQEELKALFPAENYALEETELYDNEVSDLNERRPEGLSKSLQKRLIEKEVAFRFLSKDSTEKITITRLFVTIKLDYKAAHCLTKNIELMSNIIKCFDDNKFFTIERVTLKKLDSIVCSSLYRMYQCFEKDMFGDIAYSLKKDGSDSEPLYLKNESYFKYGNNDIKISKRIVTGVFHDSSVKKAYEGLLKVTAYYDCIVNNDVKCIVSDKIKELNSIIFEIFIKHITDSFI